MGVRHLSQHWHFYQPRDNDYWTARITDECYRPNSENGILETISFNIGPTLIDWLEKEDHETLDKMISADRGQAMGQPYNHRILPLARYDEDISTQIRWGKEHFRKYFGRYPRGMWLPETASDSRTCRLMADEGIEYTIGAWWQAKDEGGSLVDPSQAYKIELGDGKSMTYFLFHPLSAEIAFNSEAAERTPFLNNADVAVDSIVRRSREDSLVLLAYDGETFGHHHKMADLWAAYFPTAAQHHPDAEMVTLDEYLDNHGALAKAWLVEKSSWSCLCGGLKRWGGGCTCAPDLEGYREEMLDVLQEQEDKVHDIFNSTAQRYLHDPWKARDDYVHVLLGEETFEDFIHKHLKRSVSEQDTSALKKLFRAEYLTQLSFTSCGWFFPDVNIQTLRNIKDAFAASDEVKGAVGQDISSRLKSLDRIIRPSPLARQ